MKTKIVVWLLIILTSVLFGAVAGLTAPMPVTAISAHYVSTTDNLGNYTDEDGNNLRFSQGDDNDLIVDTVTVRGNRLLNSVQANSIKIRRLSSNQCISSAGCDENIGGISGEKHFFQYPYTGSPLAHSITSSRANSIEGVFLSNAINIGVDNPLSNLDNNIERVDIIFSGGIESPDTRGGETIDRVYDVGTLGQQSAPDCRDKVA